jgi:hypothetical protein
MHDAANRLWAYDRSLSDAAGQTCRDIEIGGAENDGLPGGLQTR